MTEQDDGDRAARQPGGLAAELTEAGGACQPPPCEPAPAEEAQPDVTIDEEFSGLIPPLATEEVELLEKNLLEAGVCHEPLVVWGDVLLDGHHRLRLCRKHGVTFCVRMIELKDRAEARQWIIDNQLGRRNLTPEQKSLSRGSEYNAAKHPHGGARTPAASAQSEQMAPTTAEKLARKHGVGAATIRRDGDFAKGVDAIAEACGEGEKQKVLTGKSGLSTEQVRAVGRKRGQARAESAKELLSEPKRGPRGARQKGGARPTVKEAISQVFAEMDAVTARVRAIMQEFLAADLASEVWSIDPTYALELYQDLGRLRRKRRPSKQAAAGAGKGEAR